MRSIPTVPIQIKDKKKITNEHIDRRVVMICVSVFVSMQKDIILFVFAIFWFFLPLLAFVADVLPCGAGWPLLDEQICGTRFCYEFSVLVHQHDKRWAGKRW